MRYDEPMDLGRQSQDRYQDFPRYNSSS
jgi:hypothetical protein